MKKFISKTLSILLSTLMVLQLLPIAPSAGAVSKPAAFNKAYITGYRSNVIDVMNLTTHTVEKAKITGLEGPTSATVNPNGTQVFVTNHAHKRLCYRILGT